jgi:choline dehydrogenase-like flavoprotein
VKNNDVIVVGAGSVGANVAYRLAARGARVTVLEAGAPGGGTLPARLIEPGTMKRFARGEGLNQRFVCDILPPSAVSLALVRLARLVLGDSGNPPLLVHSDSNILPPGLGNVPTFDWGQTPPRSRSVSVDDGNPRRRCPFHRRTRRRDGRPRRHLHREGRWDPNIENDGT